MPLPHQTQPAPPGEPERACNNTIPIFSLVDMSIKTPPEDVHLDHPPEAGHSNSMDARAPPSHDGTFLLYSRTSD